MSGNWFVVGSSVQGLSHLRNDMPCQDALCYKVLPDGLLVAALADGAGTADFSDLGSHLAVNAAVEVLGSVIGEALPETEEGWQTALQIAFESAREALFDLSAEEDEPARSYATTLTCVVVTDTCLALATLGDGIVVAGEQDGNLLSVNKVQRGEYANETYFLTQDDAFEHLQVVVKELSITRLALLSDGLTRLALTLPAHKPHLPFFQPLFAFAEAALTQKNEQVKEKLSSFLASDRVNARTDDDKSLLLAVRSCPSVEPVTSKQDIETMKDVSSGEA